MKRQFPLYSRMAMIITIIGLAVFTGFAMLTFWSSDRYHQEVTQQLHKDLAQYILKHLPEPLLTPSVSSQPAATTDYEVNEKTLKSIAMNTMMINPGVEVYLLGTDGEILGHALPETSVDTGKVPLEPILTFLDAPRHGPILGENPRAPEQRNIFSAAPVVQDGKRLGFLYVLLASHDARSLAEQFSGSHIVRVTAAAILALTIFAALSAIFSFRRITRPLKQLSERVQDYRKNTLSENTQHDETAVSVPADEVAELSHSFELMQARIQQQFNQLNESDRLRRELISNVSHDLRTPLAAMQGYLETLLMKSAQLSHEQQQHYLEIAHRHSRHLGQLIGQLFELSKLDAGRIQPELEIFSITELVYDVKQDYELSAQQKEISMIVQSPDENIRVQADISLIQRVLQNLIDNALHYTPKGGQICIALQLDQQTVAIDISDSGSGIPAEALPFVFERHFQGRQQTADSNPTGAGLGLSIVKKILDLHGAVLNVHSRPQTGTCFSFHLPRPV